MRFLPSLSQERVPGCETCQLHRNGGEDRPATKRPTKHLPHLSQQILRQICNRLSCAQTARFYKQLVSADWAANTESLLPGSSSSLPWMSLTLQVHDSSQHLRLLSLIETNNRDRTQCQDQSSASIDYRRFGGWTKIALWGPIMNGAL